MYLFTEKIPNFITWIHRKSSNTDLYLITIPLDIEHLKFVFHNNSYPNDIVERALKKKKKTHNCDYDDKIITTFVTPNVR